MKGAAVLTTAFVSAAVFLLGIGVYDMTVRQPRTPRLALIDIAKLYASADQGLKSRAQEGAAAPAAAVSAAGA
ncbi:MAG: hypothetical protein CFE45_29700, partial [Burkholderiales bacterium PBB5]